VEADHREIDGEVDNLNPLHRFLGIAGCVIGVSGAGKTALMAKVASEMYRRKEESVSVIIRF
jgi:signal recognition particle GTPase